MLRRKIRTWAGPFPLWCCSAFIKRETRHSGNVREHRSPKARARVNLERKKDRHHVLRVLAFAERTVYIEVYTKRQTVVLTATIGANWRRPLQSIQQMSFHTRPPCPLAHSINLANYRAVFTHVDSAPVGYARHCSCIRSEWIALTGITTNGGPSTQ